MSITLSVSVACLPESRRADMVNALAAGLAADLHCDLFGTAPGEGISAPELMHLMGVWPRSLSIHLWSSGVLEVIRYFAPSPQRRLIVELLGEPDVDGVAVAAAVEAGWDVLVGCRPQLADVAVDLVRNHDLVGLQLLTTSTPGRAGGRFIEAAWPVIPRLRAQIGLKALELDGGISMPAAQKAQLLGCDMIVLGSNALNVNDEPPCFANLATLLQWNNHKGAPWLTN